MVADWSAFRVDFLAGFRYAHLTDRLTVDVLDEPAGTGDVGFYTGRTRNRLWGAQIGVVLDRPLIEFWWPGFGVRLEMKAGLLANHAKNEQFVTETETGNTLSTSATRTGFAGMIESGIRLTYSPWRYVEIHGGYQFTWLKGVVTAPNNAGNFHAINTSGSVLFHGPTVGATIRF